MNAPAVNSTPAAPRRRIWPWVVGILLTPFLLLAIAAASYLTLDSDARALRRHVTRAAACDFDTKMQFSVGRFSIGCVRTGLAFFPDNKDKIREARQALGAIKNASVGVYELQHSGEGSSAPIFAETDESMRDRGFTRVVGVAGKRETVMVYVDDDADGSEPLDICVAVVDGRQLVVVSATIDADAIAEFVDRCAGDRIRERLRERIRI